MVDEVPSETHSSLMEKILFPTKFFMNFQQINLDEPEDIQIFFENKMTDLSVVSYIKLR